jgi:hypothetical protein
MNRNHSSCPEESMPSGPDVISSILNIHVILFLSYREMELIMQCILTLLLNLMEAIQGQAPTRLYPGAKSKRQPILLRLVIPLEIAMINILLVLLLLFLVYLPDWSLSCWWGMLEINDSALI